MPKQIKNFSFLNNNQKGTIIVNDSQQGNLFALGRIQSKVENYFMNEESSDDQFNDYNKPVEDSLEQILQSQHSPIFQTQDAPIKNQVQELDLGQLQQIQSIEEEEVQSISQQSMKNDEEYQPKTLKPRKQSNKQTRGRANSITTKTSTQISEFSDNESTNEYLPQKNKTKKIQKAKKEDTKNLLRNFGGAQNKFVKDHEVSIKMQNEKYEKLEKHERIKKLKEFREWAHAKLENFKQFQEIWARPGEFGDLYREICFVFYEKYAMNYVFTSRLTDKDTRMTHQKYIYRFLEGIIDPSTFFYFKKTH